MRLPSKAAVGGLAAALAILGAAARAQPPAPDLDAGAETYGAECRACHNGAFGPSLRGVADRPAGGDAAFTGYSDALKARKDLTWTAANLDAFLKAPAELVPGTKMTKAVPDPDVRANLIAYIRSLPAPH